jgi:hypothetical protein
MTENSLPKTVKQPFSFLKIMRCKIHSIVTTMNKGDIASFEISADIKPPNICAL